MNKLIITKMMIRQVFCMVCALVEDNRIMEIRLEPTCRESILGNIYMAKVENLAENIQSAFLQISPRQRCYFPLSESNRLIYGAGMNEKTPLRPGDEVIVQVSRDAMKGKLAALTSNLNFAGKYLVLTSGVKKIGWSSNLPAEDKSRISKWLSPFLEQSDRPYGIVVRTNAADAQKEELLHEFSYLKEQFERVSVQGKSRTCFSLLYRPDPFYITAIRDSYSHALDEIVTDIPEIHEEIREYLQSFRLAEQEKLRFYQDSLLPLYKLYRIETALDTITQEKVWLKSGGFLMIQQTEAFVSIDVNTGKYTAGHKKAEETYRKINLEAAEEIARQLRLRNLSGIILIDFINMKNTDHTDELFHVLKKYLKKDHVKCKAVDITPLHIFEMTRKKVRRPIIEDLRELNTLETEKN